MPELTKQQETVVKAVENSQRGSILSLKGYAGTGKTVTASSAIKNVSDKGLNTLVIAPTAAALAVLKNKLSDVENVSFKTIASLAQTPILKVKSSAANGLEWHMDKSGLKELSTLLSSLISIDGLFSIRSKSVGVISLESAIEGVSFDTVLFDSKEANKRLKEKYNGDVPLGILSDETDFAPLQVNDIIDRLVDNEAWLVVGDEWSMVDKQMSYLIETAIKKSPAIGADIRLLVCGDGGQLQPVNGEVNELITRQSDGVYSFELSDNLRSQDKVVALATAIRGGMTIPFLANNDMFENVKQANATSVVEAWKEAGERAMNADVILCFTNRDVDAINLLKRAQLGYKPTLTKGEAVVSLRNNGYIKNETPAFVNGELLRVVDVLTPNESYNTLNGILMKSNENLTFAEKQFYKEITTAIQSGQVCIVKLITPLGEEKTAITTPIIENRTSMIAKQVRASLEAIYQKLGISFVDLGFAYAMTVHKAQGSEWPNVLYIVSGKDLWMLNKSGDGWHMPYTAVTRAKEQIDIMYIR